MGTLGGMAHTTARLCGGHLEADFAIRSAVRDGRYVVTLSGPCETRWDGEPVDEVVAEALAVAWHAAEDGSEETGRLG